MVGALFRKGRRHHSGNNLLVNSARLPSGKTFCDPSSLDADIGMLSCGLGYECILDEASTLGGLCASSTSRELQENDICFLCHFSETVAQANYDLVIKDTESGYGGKTCKDAKDAAYYSLSIDASSCETVASAARAAGCCGPKCELCDRGSIIPTGSQALYDVLDNVVNDIFLPGYDNAVTCNDLRSAGYVKGTIDVESCPASRQAAAEAGCCIVSQCVTCDVGTYIPFYVNDTTCANLSPSALLYFNNTFSEESCLASTQLAEDKGCCIPRPIYDGCNVCGNATFYPENLFFGIGTCEYAKSTLNDEYCEAYSYQVVPFCCGPSLPPDDDAEAPGPTPDGSTGVPVADSASSAMWSTGPVVVSMMCLAFRALSVGVLWLDWN
jgi:hypothetical protein